MMRDSLDLVTGILLYFLSSLGGLALVKFLNYRFCYKSWLLVALCSRGTWVLSIALHKYLQYAQHSTFRLTWKQVRLYMGVSVLVSLVEMCNAVSMNELPGSLYALLKGSDVAWSMILSYLVLQKAYTGRQILGVVIVTVGISSVFLLGAVTDNKASASGSIKEETRLSTPIASILCIVAALLNSLCSVFTEKLLKATLKEEEAKTNKVLGNEPPSKLMLSNLYSLTTSAYSFGVIFVFGLVRGDVSNIPSLSDHCVSSSHNEGSIAAIMIWTSLALIVLARFGERLTKHWMCVRDSAMTFSLTQAARRLSGIFLVAVIFSEDFCLGMWTGALCCGVGFCLHAWKHDDDAVVQSSPSMSYELVPTTSTTESLIHQKESLP